MNLNRTTANMTREERLEHYKNLMARKKAIYDKKLADKKRGESCSASNQGIVIKLYSILI